MASLSPWRRSGRPPSAQRPRRRPGSVPPTPAAEDALRQAIQTLRLEWTLPIEMLASDIASAQTVKIWDISHGYPQPTGLSLQHPDWVRDVDFLPAGDRLVTASGDTAFLWALDAPQAPLRSFAQGSPIYSAFAVSRDGRRLATTNLDKTFHVSPLRFDELYEIAQRLHAATSNEEP